MTYQYKYVVSIGKIYIEKFKSNLVNLCKRAHTEVKINFANCK